MAPIRHGHAVRGQMSATYNAYRSMLWRCSPANKADRKYYADRGIRVCKRWRGRSGFAHFLADMGEKPRGMQLDRRKNGRGYWRSNCRWATPTQNVHNRRYNPQSTKTHCPHGHPYTGQNVGWRMSKRCTQRVCRQCRRDQESVRRLKQKKE
jgi:hypothetical protein